MLGAKILLDLVFGEEICGFWEDKNCCGFDWSVMYVFVVGFLVV